MDGNKMNVAALKRQTFPTAFSNSRNVSVQQIQKRDIVYGGILQSSNNKFLLVKGRHSGKWSFPKGHIEPGETALECVCREIKEETGFQMLPAPIRCVPLKGGTYYLFWMPIEPEPTPRDTNEIEEAAWFTADEIRKLTVNVGVSTFFNQLLV